MVCKVNGHEEGVTQISWVNDVAVSKTLLLATSSLDGCLNMWNFSFASSSLTLKETLGLLCYACAKLDVFFYFYYLLKV